MTHTPGRVSVSDDATSQGGCMLRRDGEWFAQLWRCGAPWSCKAGLDTDRANARRIAALWNMADELGLSTEDIEAGILQDAIVLIRARTAPGNRLADAETHRRFTKPA